LPGASAASCTVDVVASFLLISHACVNGLAIGISMFTLLRLFILPSDLIIGLLFVHMIQI